VALVSVRRALLALAACCACAPLGAAEPATLAQIAAQMGQHAVVRADFTQTRQMAIMKRPLVSSGRVLYARGHGVLWQAEQPNRTSYALGEDRIDEIGPDGTRRERGVREVPGLSQVSRVLRALFDADTAALQQHFELSLRGDASRWELDLKPRQPQLAQFLSSLQVSGGRFVEAVRLDEASGDVTQIQFRNSKSADAPNAEELQLLRGPPAPPKR
jgi:hypothetical protein